MDKNKRTVTMMCDPDVWEKWKALADSMGLSASGMFELTARAIIDVQGVGGFSALLSFAGEVGKQAGEEYKKGFLSGQKKQTKKSMSAGGASARRSKAGVKV